MHADKAIIDYTTSNKKMNSDRTIYIHENVIRRHHVYKEMWNPACGEVLEGLETFRRLFLEVLAILDN